jgi:hypothetical protein
LQGMSSAQSRNYGRRRSLAFDSLDSLAVRVN